MTQQDVVLDEAVEAPAKLAPWQLEFELRADLVQEDIYAFEKIEQQLGGLRVGGYSTRAAAALKAAIGAGWLAAPAVEVLKDAKGEPRYMYAGENVDKMHPGKVLWLGTRVTQHYSAAITTPPN